MPTPKPAQVADYDSDESRIVSGTEVSAKTSSKRRTQEQSSSRAPKQGERASRSTAQAVPASDSGYSSTPAPGAKPASAPASAVTSTPARTAHSTSQKAATPSPAKSKPIIHRQDSARSTTRAATVSNTTAKRKDCADPNCRDPNCESSRNTERRYTIADPKRSSMPPPPPPAQTQYQYQPQYDYAAMPPPSAIPPSRRESISRPRPHSIHVPTGMPMTYPAAHPGATPGYSYGYASGAYGPQQPVYGSTPPTQTAAYSQPSPVKATVPSSPLTGTYPNFPGQTGKISARTGNPAVPGLVTSIPMPAPAPAYTLPASGGMSARTERRRSVQYPDQGRSRGDDYTSSESDSSSDERDDRRYDRHRDDQDRRRAPKAIDYERHRSKSRRRRSVVIEDPRPVARKSYTTSAVPTRQSSRRESSSRPELFYRTTSDPSGEYDSADTSRAVLERRERDRRDAINPKRRSRRLSQSTAGDSYDTPPTSISNDTGYIEAIIEDRRGSRKVYLSKEQYAELTRKYERDDRDRDRAEEQRMQQERIERYQQEWDQTAGVERQHLTATNIHKQQAARNSKSQVSGRSHKSTASGSKLSTRGGLTLESGGTMLYLEEGIQAISLKVDDDGGMRVVIPSGSGREQSYHGSKSSGSRVARSRTARERPIREEQQYEPGL